jgi:hypothetical protein
MSSSSSSQRPELKEITVAAGQEFMRQVTDYCIHTYPDLVEMLHFGRIPIACLEFQPSAKKGANIGRKALSFKRNGINVIKDQSVKEFREELIAQTIADDIALSKADLQLHSQVLWQFFFQRKTNRLGRNSEPS